MERNEQRVREGNLLAETEEIQRLCSDEHQENVTWTQTRGCAQILTIYCC